MRKIALNIIFWLSALAMVISGGLFLASWGRDWMAMNYWRNIAKEKETAADWSGEDILPRYQSLYDANPDIVGWLKIDGAHIDYPVMRTKDDPEYYLWRDFEKQQGGNGTPFVDYRCDVIPVRSFNVIIYGHNFMFRWLFEYAYQNRLYKKNKYIRFDTLNEEGIYEVAAVFYADVTGAELLYPWDRDDENAYEFYNYIEIDSADGFRKYAEKIESNQLYETDAKISMDKHIITLVSCAWESFSGFEKNGRLIVIAVQTDPPASD